MRLASYHAPATNWFGQPASGCVARSAPVRLRRARPVEQAVAFLVRLAVEQRIGNAAPEWKRSVRRILAAGWKAGVTCGSERRLLGGVGLVDRLVERIVVDVAVERRRPDPAIEGVARKQEVLAGASAPDEVDEHGPVVRLIRLGVDASVVAREEALLLKAVTPEAIVDVRAGERNPRGAVVPARLGEELSDA